MFSWTISSPVLLLRLPRELPIRTRKPIATDRIESHDIGIPGKTHRLLPIMRRCDENKTYGIIMTSYAQITMSL